MIDEYVTLKIGAADSRLLIEITTTVIFFEELMPIFVSLTLENLVQSSTLFA